MSGCIKVLPEDAWELFIVAAGKVNFQKLQEQRQVLKNLKIWVELHGVWNHDAWIDLLISLAGAGYWPMDNAALGALLESIRDNLLKTAA